MQGHEVDAGAGRPDRGGRGADRRSGGWLNACRHITGPRSAGGAYDSEALYLDERIGVPQAGHSDGRHSWVLPAAKRSPGLADLRGDQVRAREGIDPPHAAAVIDEQGGDGGRPAVAVTEAAGDADQRACSNWGTRPPATIAPSSA